MYLLIMSESTRAELVLSDIHLVGNGPYSQLARTIHASILPLER